MDVAQRLGARFMLPGNVYNFGERMPALLRPDTPQRPSTRKGPHPLRARSRDARARRQRPRSVVIRAGDFFGSGTRLAGSTW